MAELEILEKIEEKGIEFLNVISSLFEEKHHEINITCTHPISYLQKEIKDDNSGKTYWRCKCISCDQERESLPRDFNAVIRNNEKNNYSFEEVKADYKELIKTKRNIDQVYDVLRKKFN